MLLVGDGPDSMAAIFSKRANEVDGVSGETGAASGARRGKGVQR